MSENVGGIVQKEKYGTFTEQKIFVDLIKEDGNRKELYKNERQNQEDWTKKWGFFKKAKKLQYKEALKRNLPLDDVFGKVKNIENRFPSEINELNFELLPSQGVPKVSSGMIGWRIFSNVNNINLLPGPLHVSWKQTMNPPLGPDEPDLRYQRVIFLG